MISYLQPFCSSLPFVIKSHYFFFKLIGQINKILCFPFIYPVLPTLKSLFIRFVVDLFLKCAHQRSITQRPFVLVYNLLFSKIIVFRGLTAQINKIYCILVIYSILHTLIKAYLAGVLLICS